MEIEINLINVKEPFNATVINARYRDEKWKYK